jgi:hypothetical protein
MLNIVSSNNYKYLWMIAIIFLTTIVLFKIFQKMIWKFNLLLEEIIIIKYRCNNKKVL